MIHFARDVLGRPLLPWQEWLVIHAGELLPDGRPRFRQVLILVARQNGKTEVLVVLALFWQFVESVSLVLGTSTNLDYARESWEKAVELAEATRALQRRIPKRGVRRANGEQTLTTSNGARHKIATASRRGGRSLTVPRLIMDELREHHTWDAYNAALPTQAAVDDAQAFMLSNAGDDRSVVLNDLRDQALAETDPSLAIFEWSSPDEAAADDLEALAQANPSLGYTIRADVLLNMARRAVAADGEQLAGFLTEHHCRRVRLLDPAIDPAAWEACASPGTLDGVRNLALCFDVSVDGLHAALYAAGMLPDKRARVDAVKSWVGPNAGDLLAGELPELVRTIRPRSVGWYPGGPAAAVAASMSSWRPPAGVNVEAIRGAVPAVCMGFVEQVNAHGIAHSREPLLDTHVAGAEKINVGDGWRFTRRGAGHVNALYAAAGAVHLARTQPTSRFMVVGGSRPTS